MQACGPEGSLSVLWFASTILKSNICLAHLRFLGFTDFVSVRRKLSPLLKSGYSHFFITVTSTVPVSTSNRRFFLPGFPNALDAGRNSSLYCARLVWTSSLDDEPLRLVETVFICVDDEPLVATL